MFLVGYIAAPPTSGSFWATAETAEIERAMAAHIAGKYLLVRFMNFLQCRFLLHMRNAPAPSLDSCHWKLIQSYQQAIGALSIVSNPTRDGTPGERAARHRTMP